MFKMNQQLKSIIKKTVPKSILSRIPLVFSASKLKKAREIFEQASETSAWLGWDVLELYQHKYPIPSVYNYDPWSLEQRGKSRAKEILSLVRREKKNLHTFLELGCGDGMVSCFLQRMGKTATAIDIKDKNLDRRLINEGVTFIRMDASNLCFENESFDFVFSYDTFEHFAEPELVLQEAIRVVRKGGYIYFKFGPLYMSPMGLHIYRVITVPYCQFLFPMEMLKKFAKVKKLEIIDFPEVNKWSLEDYRKLWNKYNHKLSRVKYYEYVDTSHLDLIIKHPSCFKSKTKNMDNLIVSSIEILFKKKFKDGNANKN